MSQETTQSLAQTMEQMTLQELIDPFKSRKFAISESAKAQKANLLAGALK